ncbi:hypothetical protein PTI98_008294 [Pleurotus ostreatus]|nr:hypothetical protein PTI98_008294 [Pleurotus ostreatus]
MFFAEGRRRLCIPPDHLGHTHVLLASARPSTLVVAAVFSMFLLAPKSDFRLANQTMALISSQSPPCICSFASYSSFLLSSCSTVSCCFLWEAVVAPLVASLVASVFPNFRISESPRHDTTRHETRCEMFIINIFATYLGSQVCVLERALAGPRLRCFLILAFSAAWKLDSLVFTLSHSALPRLRTTASLSWTLDLLFMFLGILPSLSHSKSD